MITIAYAIIVFMAALESGSTAVLLWWFLIPFTASADIFASLAAYCTISDVVSARRSKKCKCTCSKGMLYEEKEDEYVD